MIRRSRALRRLLSDVPRYAKLAYCLSFDERVPARNKALLLAALVLVFSPVVDIPMWLPVLGQMDVLALSLLATRLFVSAAPDDVVDEQELLIRQGRSRFDQDVRSGGRFALIIARRLRGAGADMQVDGVALERATTRNSSEVRS